MFWLKFLTPCIALWLGVAVYVYCMDQAALAQGGKGMGMMMFLFFTPIYIAVCALIGIGLRIMTSQNAITPAQKTRWRW